MAQHTRRGVRGIVAAGILVVGAISLPVAAAGGPSLDDTNVEGGWLNHPTTVSASFFEDIDPSSSATLELGTTAVAGTVLLGELDVDGVVIKDKCESGRCAGEDGPSVYSGNVRNPNVINFKADAKLLEKPANEYTVTFTAVALGDPALTTEIVRAFHVDTKGPVVTIENATISPPLPQEFYQAWEEATKSRFGMALSPEGTLVGTIVEGGNETANKSGVDHVDLNIFDGRGEEVEHALHVDAVERAEEQGVYDWEFNTVELGPGYYTVFATGRDIAGNPSNRTGPVNFLVAA
ncbi:MAG TPA: hypothetical protein VGB83_01995 [Actinomycetota bacterium]